MTTLSATQLQPPAVPHVFTGLRVALCGSFRRDPDGLRSAYDALAARFEIVSPVSLDFVDPAAEFVRLAHERDEQVPDIERRHLSAMRSADFVWLHAPGGYVGRSASMELGFAKALGIPVFCDVPPDDEVLRDGINVVAGVAHVQSSGLEQVDDPGEGLSRLQRYYKTVAERRGWASESARDTLLLLTEEMGELARAIRKSENLARHHRDKDVAVAEELADVQLYLVHLANTLELDLSRAVTAKERVNAERFAEADVA